MAVTSTSICNSALIKIGAARIGSLNDDSKEARLCKEQYDKLRRQVLRSHPWNFAIKRADLAQDADTPLFGFDFQYPIPQDCLRILNTSLTGVPYKIEQNLILTDSDELKILYIFDQEDASLFDENFQEALAFRIAAELAYPIAQSRTLARDMFDAYKDALREARSFDAQEGTPEAFIADTWILSRDRGTFFGAGEL